MKMGLLLGTGAILGLAALSILQQPGAAQTDKPPAQRWAYARLDLTAT